MELTVPAPELIPPYDILVYLDPKSRPLIFGTSLEETRSVKEFLDLLKAPDGKFHLQTLQDRQVVDIEGTIRPGKYIVVGEAQKYYCSTMQTLRKEATLLRGTASGENVNFQSTFPSRKDNSRFKSRLIARDKGCVVCMAKNQDNRSMYLYKADSKIFVGVHIFALQYYDLWDRKGYSQIVVDPYSAPGASTSTNRQNTDMRRMNSIDNGLLLCVEHRVHFDMHLFSIHPDTHIVTSFHPRTGYINGLTVTQPWLNGNIQYPPPNRTLLGDHFRSSMARWMIATSEQYEEDPLSEIAV